jgi:hypothetical protein
MEIINWKIISHPMNWIVLFLMVFIAGLAIHWGAKAVGYGGNIPLPSTGSPLPPTI